MSRTLSGNQCYGLRRSAEEFLVMLQFRLVTRCSSGVVTFCTARGERLNAALELKNKFVGTQPGM